VFSITLFFTTQEQHISIYETTDILGQCFSVFLKRFRAAATSERHRVEVVDEMDVDSLGVTNDGMMFTHKVQEVDGNALCVVSWTDKRMSQNSSFQDYITQQFQPEWQPDEEAVACTGCQLPFSIKKRKHHCRRCGEIFCGACSGQRMLLPHLSYGTKVQRVCDRCFRFRTEQLEFLKRGMLMTSLLFPSDLASVTKEEVRMWLVVEDDTEEVILQWSSLTDPYRFATTRLPLFYITDVIIRFIGYESSPIAPIARKSRNLDAERMFTVRTTTAEYHFELATKYKFKQWTKALRECILQYKNKELRVAKLKAREAAIHDDKIIN